MSKVFPVLKNVFIILSCCLWIFVTIAFVSEYWNSDEESFDMASLKKDQVEIDIEKAKKILDRDHQGLGKAKEHIIEYLAVQKRVPNGKAPILCFMGPPGVGKTTLAKSIAEATNRKFVQIALGGIDDEAKIRGFMRAYVGARPGEIVNALKEAGTSNPVILLDEIDKLVSGNSGDPAAALLEVLDPSQNTNFKDHYIEAGIDLSNVMFIATANSYADIPVALLDRLEIIELSSYTLEEKLKIAQTSLVPKQLKKNGLSSKEFSISESALKKLITGYTLEPGVRELDRLIGTLCRKVVKEAYDGKSKSEAIGPESLQAYLGKPPVAKSKSIQKDTVGATYGLAWSPAGGSTIIVEVAILEGNGSIITTGDVGDIWEESVWTALTVAKQMLPQYKQSARYLADKNVHVHTTDWNVDGPSAGAAMMTSMISAITKIAVRKDVCMTGEINLQGEVLEVGGLKEKLIAAHNAGLKTAIIPADNVSDLADIPEVVKTEMKILPVKHVSEVLKIALVS